MWVQLNHAPMPEQLNNPPDSPGCITYGFSLVPTHRCAGVLVVPWCIPMGWQVGQGCVPFWNRSCRGGGSCRPSSDAAEGTYLTSCISPEAPGSPVSCDKAPPLQCPKLELNTALSVSWATKPACQGHILTVYPKPGLEKLRTGVWAHLSSGILGQCLPIILQTSALSRGSLQSL